MRVALGKIDGVESVDVTLKRGVAHIRLKEGNTVTLAGLRRIIKDAGYTSREAVVVATGRLVQEGGSQALSVSGTSERFRLEADPATPRVLSDGTGAGGAAVEISGTVLEPAGTGPSVLRVRAIAAR